jgi:2-furoyl-CoA dehydrogenase large subunit
MSTPVCLANAVADALGVDDVTLPLTPSRVLDLLDTPEPAAPERPTAERTISGYAVTGHGSTLVPAAIETVWAHLTDPDVLRRTVPGCRELTALSATEFEGRIEMGAGIVKGVFAARMAFSDMDPPNRLCLTGSATGRLGASRGEGLVRLKAEGDGTRVSFEWGVDLSGKVAAVGGRLVAGVARLMIGEFFRRLARSAAPDAPADGTRSGLSGLFNRLRGRR